MRINNVFSGRPAPVDRNPLDIFQAGAATAVAPHANVVRVTYTVPTGRKAQIENTFTVLYRVTAATTVGQADAVVQWNITPFPYANWSELYFNNNVAAIDKNITGQLGYLLAGDSIRCYDDDTSVGGTVTFSESIKGTEFDA